MVVVPVIVEEHRGGCADTFFFFVARSKGTRTRRRLAATKMLNTSSKASCYVSRRSYLGVVAHDVGLKR